MDADGILGEAFLERYKCDLRCCFLDLRDISALSVVAFPTCDECGNLRSKECAGAARTSRSCSACVVAEITSGASVQVGVARRPPLSRRHQCRSEGHLNFRGECKDLLC